MKKETKETIIGCTIIGLGSIGVCHILDSISDKITRFYEVHKITKSTKILAECSEKIVELSRDERKHENEEA